MGDWKDDKDKGPWLFTPQPDKWGYLNNPRWLTPPATPVNYSDDRDNEPVVWDPGYGGLGHRVVSSDKHFPCGHWHRRKYVWPTIELDFGLTQQSMDIFHERVAICGMLTDHPRGLICVEGVVGCAPTDWYFLGQANGISQYLEPSTLRISSERGYIAFFGSFYEYYGALNYNHLGFWKFERDYYPTYVEVFLNDFVTDELDDYQIYNIGDCYLDRVAMAARYINKGGASFAYWAIKVSSNEGESFTEWTFPTPTSAYGGQGYRHDRVQIRISQDQTVWACYLRSSGVSGTHQVELWKSNYSGTSFSLVWQDNFYSKLNNCEAYGFSFDINEYGGEQLIIHLMGVTGGVYTQLVYYLTNYGAGSISYSHTYSSANYPFSRGVADAPFVCHGAEGDNFLRSVNGGALFNTVFENRLSGSYVEHQKHHNEQIYTECSRDFGIDPEFMGYLYSKDNGLIWTAYQTPFPVGSGPTNPITLTSYPGYVDEIVSETIVNIHDTQTGDYRTVDFNTMPGLFQGRDYRTVVVTDVPWG